MLRPMGLRTVILRHDLPDGSGHFDWMFALDDPPASRLATWRCAVRPDESEVGAVVPMEALAPHRTAYLTFEGPLDGGRGSVRRVAAGWWRPAEDVEPARALAGEGGVEIAWDGSAGRQHWLLAPRAATRCA